MIKELRQFDTITVHPSFLGGPVYQAASWGRPDHSLVALVGHGPGGSRSAFAGNGHGIKIGLPIVRGANAGSPDADATPSASGDTDTAAPTPSHANARSTGAGTAYAGTSSHRGGANTSTCPDSGTAYSASHITYGGAHFVTDAGLVPHPDSHLATLPSDADAAAIGWGQPTDCQLG